MDAVPKMKYKGYTLSRKMRRFSQIMWCVNIAGVWHDRPTRKQLERWIDEREAVKVDEAR